MIKDKDFRKVLSENLQMILDEKGLLRTDLAKKLNCSTATVSKWMTCKTEPTLTYLIKITKVLNCTFEELIGE